MLRGGGRVGSAQGDPSSKQKQPARATHVVPLLEAVPEIMLDREDVLASRALGGVGFHTCCGGALSARR